MLTSESHEESLSLLELIKGIILYPKSLFNYVASKSYTRYYLIFILLFAFLETVKILWEEYSFSAHDYLVLLMAIIPLKVFVVIAGQLILLILLFGVALTFGGKGNLKEFIKINSYSNLPLIIAIILYLLIYLLDNSFHFIDKSIFFALLCLDIAFGFWSACLFVFSVSATMKITYTKAILVSGISIMMLLFLYYMIFVPYSFNHVF